LSLRICLVTTEFHGLFKNGGIGTANTGLALMLAAAGHEATVAYVDPDAAPTLGQNEAFLAQRERWRERGIFLDFVPRWPRLKAAAEDFCWTLSTLEYLKARRFDVVLFNECGGHGYYALLAKRAGVFPDAPRMIVVTHGASDWARELNGQLPVNYRAAALGFFERRSVELADLVVSPSDYLVGWMREHGWRLPAETEILQNVLPAAPAPRPPAPAAIDEIVFFGRLESRKGVEIFCDAIDELDRAGRLGAVGVTFLGKFSRVGAVHSGVFLIERSKGWSVAPRFLADLGQQEALDYLSRPGVLAVMPSLAENSPCVVVECLAAGVPFVATDSGGTAELIAEADRGLCLAPPQAQAIAGKIAQVLQRGPAQARLAQPQSDTAARWRAWVERVETPPAPPARDARVSICLSVAAGGEIAPETLESLRRQTGAEVELVIVAYGAEADRREAGEAEIRLARRSPDRAAARNSAAAAARGEWLMFVRERDVLEPRAVATLVAAAGRLGAEAVSGLAYELRRPGRPSLDWDGEIGSPPFGPCAGLAAFENCLGDGVFVISRAAFERLGGYESGVSPAIEDRLLLTRALAAGTKLDLAPAPLAWRRVPPRGQGDEVADIRRVLGVFRDAPLAAFSAVVESLFAQGPQQIRARAAAWLAPLDEKARDLAYKLTFPYPAGGAESYEPFLRYCLERGRLVEAVDFARRHDPAALAPIAEAALARQAERNVRQSLRAAAASRPISVSLAPEIVERLRLVAAPGGVGLERDAHCLASIRLTPGLTVAKAPLACPSGAERLQAWVDFSAAPDPGCEVALVAAEPSAQALVVDGELRAQGGVWWSGWRRAAPEGLRVEVEALPAASGPLDVFLLGRMPALAGGPTWAVWRSLTAQGTLSGLATPSGVQADELRHRLPLHLLKAAQLLTDASDFPFSVFVAGDFTLHHPLPGRMALVRVAGAVPPGAAGISAAFSVENERAHPVAFAFWIREPGAPPPGEDSGAEGGAASGWTLCETPLTPKTAEARLSAPASSAMDLYLATKVVGFDDVNWCHAGWRELAAIEALRG
jgi:glycosyltransferase involved in cell wall biosynthesis